MMHSVVQRVGDAASWVGGYLTEAGKNAVIAGLKSYFPDLEAVLQSLQEMKISTTLIHSLRQDLLTKIRNADSSELMSSQLSDYFVGEPPFLNIDSDANNVVPEQVSQLKKIINALYHAEECLKLIEQHTGLLSTSTVQDLYGLIFDLIPHAKELIQISSSLDVNLPSYFSGELAQLTSLINLFQQAAGPQVDSFLNGSTWSHLQQKASVVGHYAGVATDQLHPHTGQTDFRFLTTFGGVLSGHISALTDQIRSYAAPSTARPSLMTPERLDELTFAADELYRKLTQLQASGVSDPLSIAPMLKHPMIYTEIFGHIRELSTSILTQVNEANKSAQDAIIHQLFQLKHEHLLKLFCFIDKIELYGAFKPGALSKPLLIYLKSWYELLVTQAHSVADIKKIRPELLVIEDSHFVHARMDATLTRKLTFTTKELSLKNVPHAMHEFFAIIKKFSDDASPLRELASNVNKRELLLGHYQFIRPFMLHKNPMFDLRLLRDLDHPAAQGMIDDNALFADEKVISVKECLELEKEMSISLSKAIKSQEFYKRLAEDMLQGIFSRVDTLILPYSFPGNNPFRMDESHMLGMTPPESHDPRFRFERDHIFLTDTMLQDLFNDPSRDVHSHTPRLYEGYQVYIEKLLLAKNACDSFKELMRAQNGALDKPALRDLYIRIQPYLMHAPLIPSATGSETNAARIALDQAMIDCLGEHPNHAIDESSTQHAMQRLINVALTSIHHHLQLAHTREEPFKEATQRFLSFQVKNNPIEFDAGACKRLRHVFSHTHYSENVKKLSEAVRSTLPLFSAPIREDLATHAVEGLPFPVLTDEIESLKTSEQVLLLKQLMNALYYIEYFFEHMEKLSSQSYEIINSVGNTVYLMKAFLLGAIPFINIVNNIRANPDLAILMKDVLKRVNQMQAVWLQLKPLYSISSRDVGHSAEVAQSNGTWYSMLGMTVLPNHLRALKMGLGFSSADAEPHQRLAKDTTLRIEHILSQTDTNFHLFLASSEMLKVFHRVKDTLAQFSGETYDAVMMHLQSIREETFPALLIEMDDWERRLGIVPGTISKTVKKMLDEFYISLIEPLSLPSERHIALASSLTSFKVRADALHFQMKLAEAESFRLNPLIEIFDELIQAIEAPSGVDNRERLMASLTVALPLLRENQHRHSLGITRRDQDDRIDRLCHELMPVETVGLKHIKCLVKRCKADYEGRRASQQFTQAMIYEQLSQLAIDQAAQIAENQAYKTRYVTGLLHRHIDALVSEQTDILSLKAAYGESLKQFLLAQEETIVTELVLRENSENLQIQMEELLRLPLEQFAATEYRHYMKLQSILVAITAFEYYLDQESAKLARYEWSSFETVATLAAKRAHIVRMRDIANDDTLSAAERLGDIQDVLTQRGVQSDLLAFHQYDRFSWDGLKQIFLQLLQTIGLYTPGYEFEYARLDSVANADAPDAAQFLQSYGLFSTRRNYSLPQALQAEAVVSIGPLH